MAVFRVERTGDYTVMSNFHLKDKRLSLKAKGLLSQMLSLPDDWDYTLSGLSYINRESKDAIRSAVNELETAGYIRRRQTTDASGKFAANEYTIFERPIEGEPMLDKPLSENPITVNPSAVNPLPENPTQLNTKKSNTQKQNTHLQCKESIEAAVREHFDGMYLSHDAAKGVIETYGMERVALVLANTVQLQDWDGRYSRRNKEWAKTIPNENPETVRCGYVLNSHPAVLDGFIDLVREEQQRSRTQGEKLQPSRPSVRDKLKQELPAHKPAASKKREPER